MHTFIIQVIGPRILYKLDLGISNDYSVIKLRVVDDGSLFSAWKIKREAFSPLKLPFIINKCLKKKFALILSCHILWLIFSSRQVIVNTLIYVCEKSCDISFSSLIFFFFLHLLGFCCTVCKKSSKIFAYILGNFVLAKFIIYLHYFFLFPWCVILSSSILLPRHIYHNHTQFYSRMTYFFRLWKEAGGRIF